MNLNYKKEIGDLIATIYVNNTKSRVVESLKNGIEIFIDSKYIEKNQENANAYKVYCLESFGEKTWIAAQTIIQALKVDISLSEGLIEDFDDTDDIYLVPKSEWESIKITYEEGIEDSNIKIFMDDVSGPELICSTAYL